ncbi:outer membrane protein assembly factor BamC [Candidatus Blochmannia vicinus (nom. nud.)]|uniref:Outer membrane protein assembly factor BamC n=1 Tax=Candidatus Blochmannia vicinus (nom. nud.) TaxID=251540 RepID=A0A9Q8TWM7_9ENTR|nr:outer membrane protein assembly factor BamC [Candidatus Blochmannia vicinus]URJ28262.1 outer membrane protein assembly factor BamC [Candidatus Blochmannia vicinus]
MLTFLEILCVIFLSACCSSEILYKENRCKLSGNLEYLDTVALLELNLPEDLDILLPVSYDDYVIPKISNVNDSNTQKIGKKLNICPPPVVFLTETTHTSCLINSED